MGSTAGHYLTGLRIARLPGKSNRAIAAETGVSYETVRKARKQTDNQLSVEKAQGLDGEVRRLPQRKTPSSPDDPIQEGCAECANDEER